MALNHSFLSVDMLKYFSQPARPNNNNTVDVSDTILLKNTLSLLEPDKEARIEVDPKNITQILNGCFVDVCGKVHNSLRKLVSIVGKWYPSVREEVHNVSTNMVDGEPNHGALNDLVIAERGVGIDLIDRSMGKGVRPKMERFKVRPIKVIVKED